MSDIDITDTDVLVAGLGPAGASAAAAAAAAGHRVIAIDRKADAGTPVQCAEFVPMMLGQEIHDLDHVACQRIAAMETYTTGAAPDRMDNFPGHMIDRRAFDRALVAKAQAAGAECRFGVAIREVSPDGVVTLSDGARLRGRILIGADGPRSRVGAAAGRMNAEIVETRQITVPLLKPHDATDIFLSAELPGGYAWLFPRGDVANLGAGVVADHKFALKELIEDLHEELLAQGRVGEEVISYTGGPIPVGGRLDPVAALGEVPVLLAGDAGGLTNPVTGAGIASAVISGTLAGDAAAEWLDGDADAFQAYDEELSALFDGALTRALHRRRELLRVMREDTPAADDFHRGWIAYPDYWADYDNQNQDHLRGNAA